MGTLLYANLIGYDPRDLFPASELDRIVGKIYKNIIRDDNVIFGRPCVSGSILASPSVPSDPETDQNYTYDWTRDSALTIIEIISIIKSGALPAWEDRLVKVVESYIRFVSVVQANSTSVSLGYARWNLNGTPSDGWTIQNDGPGLRIIALSAAINASFLQPLLRDQAILNIQTDLDYLSTVYSDSCFNIWEEVYGDHFFTKKIIRRAFFECKENQIFTSRVSAEMIDQFISRLEEAMANHIMAEGYYKSNMATDAAGQKGNDKNIDVLLALLYGEIGLNPVFSISTLPSIATVASVVSSFISEYPINIDDMRLGLGPNLGRYPFDVYDGDMTDGYNIGHPWFISSNSIACFFYKLAALSQGDEQILPIVDSCFSPIYGQQIKSRHDLVSLGDRHVLTTKRHWSNGAMSEQYDKSNGFMKSVADLTWSYASYLMAARLRPSSLAE